MNNIEWLNKHITGMKSIILRDDIPNQIIDMYTAEIKIYETEKVYLSLFNK